MKKEEMTDKQCPFKAGNCQGVECMAASKHPEMEDYYCSLIEVPVITHTSPVMIPEGYSIREIKND